MRLDDPRHGTNRGWAAHRAAGEPACTACRAGNAAAQRRGRKIRALYGPRIIDATGTRRRVEALIALGWSGEAIAARLGMNQRNLWSTIRRPRGVYLSTAKRIARVYDGMSMTLPPATTKGERISVSRSLGLAARRGWPPPLAWDDIDNDPAPADATVTDRRPDLYDHAVVERVLASGERPRRLTHTECEEIVRRALARGMSTHDIRDVYGIKAERHVRVSDPEEAA